MLVGVSSSHDRGVGAAFTTFPELFTKTSVSGPNWRQKLARCLLLNTVTGFIFLVHSRACRFSKSVQLLVQLGVERGHTVPNLPFHQQLGRREFACKWC